MGLGTFFDVSTLHLAIPPLRVVRTPFLLLVLGLVGLALHHRAWRPKDAQRSRMFKCLAVVVIVAILGVPFAILSSFALQHLIDVYSKILLQGAMLWAVTRRSADRLIVVRLLMAAIVIQCVLAIIAPRGAGGRLSGMFDHDANSLALLANILLPLLAWYMLDKRNRLRWLAVAAVPIALMTLVLASSRGGFLAFGAMAASTVFLASRRAPKPLRRLFPIAATMALVGVALAPADVTQRVTAMIDGSDYNYTSDGGRMAIWKRGMGYAFSNPIFGVGFGNFGAAEGSSEIAARYAREGRGFVRNTAHSTYVEVLAEVGLIGGGAFILLLFLTIRDLFRAARSANRTRDPDAVLVGAFGIAVLGYAVSIAFLSYAWFSAGYILYGVAYGYIDGLDRPRHHRGLPASVMAHPRGGPKRPVQVAPPLTTARVYRPSP